MDDIAYKQERLTDTLAEILEHPPESGQVLYFLLEFFAYLEEEYGTIPVSPEEGVSEDYSAFISGLLRSVPAGQGPAVNALSRKLLLTVAGVLSPETAENLSEQERLTRMFDLLTVQDLYRAGATEDFEAAMKQYFSAGLRRIEADVDDCVRRASNAADCERLAAALTLEQKKNLELQQKLDSALRRADALAKAVGELKRQQY